MDDSQRTQMMDVDIHELFSSHGLRFTRQRKLLYEALAATKAHPTADQLFHEVCHQDRGISLATVYNTLEAFCRVGLAQKLAGNSGPAHYDATVENHLHLRDIGSDRVADVPEDLSAQILSHLPRELIQQLEQRMGFKVRQVQVELIGRFA